MQNSYRALKVAFVPALLLGLWLMILCSAGLARAASEEVSIFDRQGSPVAYVASDADRTIYLWDGTPVAYVYEDSLATHIYAFSGRHLGWIDRGVIVDHDGAAVGFLAGALSIPTQYEPYKGFKKLKPLKGLRELAPVKPAFPRAWSERPLRVFLFLPEAEPAILLKSENNGNTVVVMRRNGQKWLLMAKTWCSWAWKYEGKEIWIEFSYTTTEAINDEGEKCEFWTEKQVF